MNKNLYLNNSEKDWLLRIRSILNKTKKNQIILPPNDEIWYTSSDGNIIRPLSGFNIDVETGDSIPIYGPYNDIFGADIISNTYENGKGIIKFDGDVTKLEPSEDFIEDSSMFIDLNYDSRLISINLPNSVTSIGSYAFYNCTKLISINIPDSVTSIGNGAFSDCTGLTSITIPDSVTSIGEFAFVGVLNVNYNGSATGNPWGANCVNGYIENDIVYTDNTKTQLVGINKLYSGSINIPNSVTSIGEFAFSECTGLTSINIPNSVTSIGESAFQHCNLTSIIIPNSVTSIGESAFQYCNLTSITIPNSVTSIGKGAFYNCTGLTSITIPDSVTSISEHTFAGCFELTSITIPNSVTSIGVGAFFYTGLNSINIPNSVTSIGDGAFENCRVLTIVNLPDSVTNIGSAAFIDCIRLTSITVLKTTPPTLGTNVFSIGETFNIYVPAGSVETYKTAKNWSNYSSHIQPIQ